MWSSRADGSVMHVLLTHGHVKVKDWFSAGGWAGYVKSVGTTHTIYNSNNSNTNSNSNNLNSNYSIPGEAVVTYYLSTCWFVQYL